MPKATDPQWLFCWFAHKVLFGDPALSN